MKVVVIRILYYFHLILQEKHLSELGIKPWASNSLDYHTDHYAIQIQDPNQLKNSFKVLL